VVIDQGDFRFSSAARSGCAINTAIEVLGDPWSMLVLRDVIISDRHHFRELLQGSEAVSTHPRAGSEIASAE
jgi:DNA-binding HxlR family transcriptional regulator